MCWAAAQRSGWCGRSAAPVSAARHTANIWIRAAAPLARLLTSSLAGCPAQVPHLSHRGTPARLGPGAALRFALAARPHGDAAAPGSIWRSCLLSILLYPRLDWIKQLDSAAPSLLFVTARRERAHAPGVCVRVCGYETCARYLFVILPQPDADIIKLGDGVRRFEIFYIRAAVFLPHRHLCSQTTSRRRLPPSGRSVVLQRPVTTALQWLRLSSRGQSGVENVFNLLQQASTVYALWNQSDRLL